LDKINPKTVAKYIGNHLDTPNALDKLTQVLMRYNQHKSLSDDFVSQMLKELNIYKAKSAMGVLPQSFSEKSAKNLYLSLIKAKDLSQSS